LNQCSGRCWSSEAYPPLPELRNDYRGGFAASLMLKDLALARDAAAEAARKSSSFSSSWTPLGDAAAVAYRACPGSDDFSSVFRHFYGGGKAAES
jgi:3-hydroxyisobutyrate dehydrogenase